MKYAIKLPDNFPIEKIDELDLTPMQWADIMHMVIRLADIKFTDYTTANEMTKAAITAATKAATSEINLDSLKEVIELSNNKYSDQIISTLDSRNNELVGFKKNLTDQLSDVSTQLLIVQKNTANTWDNTIEAHMMKLYTEEIQSLRKICNRSEESVKDLTGKLQQYIQPLVKFHTGTAMEKGNIGESLIKEMIQQDARYADARIIDTSAAVSSGDIVLKWKTLSTLIEVKNKVTLVKNDMDKFITDVKLQSESKLAINSAIFISHKSHVFPGIGHDKMYIEILDHNGRIIPIVYLYLESVNDLHYALLSLNHLVIHKSSDTSFKLVKKMADTLKDSFTLYGDILDNNNKQIKTKTSEIKVLTKQNIKIEELMTNISPIYKQAIAVVQDNKAKVVASDKPVVNGDKPVVNGDKPVVNSDKVISIGHNNDKLNTDKPIVTSDKPTTDKPVVDKVADDSDSTDYDKYEEESNCSDSDYTESDDSNSKLTKISTTKPTTTKPPTTTKSPVKSTTITKQPVDKSKDDQHQIVSSRQIKLIDVKPKIVKIEFKTLVSSDDKHFEQGQIVPKYIADGVIQDLIEITTDYILLDDRTNMIKYIKLIYEHILLSGVMIKPTQLADLLDIEFDDLESIITFKEVMLNIKRTYTNMYLPDNIILKIKRIIHSHVVDKKKITYTLLKTIIDPSYWPVISLMCREEKLLTYIIMYCNDVVLYNDTPYIDEVSSVVYKFT